MFSLLLWAPMVSAQDFVTEIGEVVALERGANWVRTFPKDDETWWLTLGLGGDYGVTTITKDLVWDEKGLVGLTGRTYLIDNAIMRCASAFAVVVDSGGRKNSKPVDPPRLKARELVVFTTLARIRMSVLPPLACTALPTLVNVLPATTPL